MKKLLVICGPTASGKTALAVECARRIGGEIVSCDAFLIYRGLNIGTAKPTEEEMGGVRHHMIDVAEPSQEFSVSDFARLGGAAVEEICARGKTPILCGGTGFYVNALLYKSSFGNISGSKEIREKYARLEREEGREALHARLAAVDPESAEKLHPNDVKRVVRALEIYEQTGVKKSLQNDGNVARYPFVACAFDYPREELYARIDRRVEDMLEAGLVEEVKGLLASGVAESAQSMQGIGYKEVVGYLKNDYNFSTMRDIIKQKTRNYAKRQLTFFKRLENLHLIKPADTASAAQEVLEIYGRE